jgi:hypothetical protein
MTSASQRWRTASPPLHLVLDSLRFHNRNVHSRPNANAALLADARPRPYHHRPACHAAHQSRVQLRAIAPSTDRPQQAPGENNQENRSHPPQPQTSWFADAHFAALENAPQSVAPELGHYLIPFNRASGWLRSLPKNFGIRRLIRIEPLRLRVRGN